MIPHATYRLQFSKAFGFDQAAELAPYLAKLGVSHLYAAPYLKARPGSEHGYDIVDHNTLNPELGDATAFERMSQALRQLGLRQILDFVPNHMGVGGADNPLWLDVLAWGPDSRFAGWFDIDWTPDQRYLQEKLLVPFLGDQYGVELESGNLALKFDEDEGSFAVWAYEEHKLPICPIHYAQILADAHSDLEWLGDAFAGLREWRPQITRRARELQAVLARKILDHPNLLAAVQAAVARLNGEKGRWNSWHGLAKLIDAQYWRAAHFRVAADDINYRRFFNINDLAGLRMESPDVFDHVHRLVFRLLDDGTVDGLRIDHIDGLLDPKSYLQGLRDRAPRKSDGQSFYLIVEKILAPHESLREDWPVHGTTGYDFANLVLGLMVDAENRAAFSQAYVDFTGQREPFAKIVRECKLRIMENEMASELNVLARDAGRVAHQNLHTADFTRNVLHRALKHVVACFPVYRTYVDTTGAPTEADRRDLDWAIAQARRNDPDLDPSIFDFVHRMLSGDLVAKPRSGFSRSSVLRAAMKLQQYSGPVMAKGLEDTAFYRYNRFVGLNEVGGDPAQFGIALKAFHQANMDRGKRWPHAMLGTSTHDTKRGEDTRARLAALSELPEEWTRQVQAWSRILHARRGDVEGTAAPDRNDEYLLYQALVGSWPIELFSATQDAALLQAFGERIKGAMVKSIREAKVHSTWASPNTAYESAMLALVDAALDPERSDAFLASFVPFAERVARLGAQNTLIQTVLKLTAPGVPDIYQGAELWDLSLVDPDNRRPVDYASRKRMLDEVLEALATDRPAAMGRFMREWRNAKFKLATIVTLLDIRRCKPDLFARGGYEPVIVESDVGQHTCAFLRRWEDNVMLVAVQRFPARRETQGLERHAVLRLPSEAQATQFWRDLLCDQVVEPDQEGIAAAKLFVNLPAAVLVPATGSVSHVIREK